MTPAECMAYTEVFQALKLEVSLAAIFGILIGIVIGRKS